MAVTRRELDRKQVSKDYFFDKLFLRSIRYMNQEIAATHILKLVFFVQVIEKLQGKIIPIFIIFCRHESTNNEAYSYDKHNQETR